MYVFHFVQSIDSRPRCDLYSFYSWNLSSAENKKGTKVFINDTNIEFDKLYLKCKNLLLEL